MVFRYNIYWNKRNYFFLMIFCGINIFFLLRIFSRIFVFSVDIKLYFVDELMNVNEN